MTVPGGDTGENPPGGADQSWPESTAQQPQWGASPSSGGFAAGPVGPPGYPPGFGVPPGPPPGYPPPGYGPPGYGAPPSYSPPGYGPPSGFAPPGYGAPYPGGYVQPAGKNNALAITSLVTSIIGALFALLSFFFVPLTIVGVILGIIALNQIKRTGEGGHGLAVAGIAVGAVTLVLGLFVTLAILQ